MAELPTIIEALGEHLYIKIEHLTQVQSIETDIGKLTGILLETGEKEVGYSFHILITNFSKAPISFSIIP